jgi:hypothetical protein
MSNVRTITDLPQEETISIVLSNAEDRSTQTSLSQSEVGFNINEGFREIVNERLTTEDFRLPYRRNLNDDEIWDSGEIENLNSVLDINTIRMILTGITENTYDSNILRTILFNLSDNSRERIASILNQPTTSIETYTPILNLLLYANTGIGDLNLAAANLSALITDISFNIEIPNFEENLEEAARRVDANTEEANRDNEERNQEHRANRRSILQTINWRALLRRSGMVLMLGAVAYTVQPYLAPAMSVLGNRVLESTESGSTDSGLTQRPNNQRNITFRDVSNSFWRSWGLLTRYMGGGN